MKKKKKKKSYAMSQSAQETPKELAVFKEIQLEGVKPYVWQTKTSL